ncbi:MAG TPA: SCO1664 family protein [Herpetosiphonaceae bacterium]|nr:SCO1664 family protein [Herpetosiphonaceae bacterium]
MDDTQARPTPPDDDPDATPNTVPVGVERVLALLLQGTLDLEGLMPDSSNYTFLVRLKDEELEGLAIYKPRRGERPLWDFPRGTLCKREAAAYTLSEALGWQLVPPTVLRDAEPHGYGSVQLFVDADPRAHYFSLQGSFDDTFKRIAAFDILANNADRKGGHILLGNDDRLWAIDHGITFHPEPKLRTVIWEYAGSPIPPELLADITGLATRLEDDDDPLRDTLRGLLDRNEIDALRRRTERLLKRPQFPYPGGNRSMPWPPI